MAEPTGGMTLRVIKIRDGKVVQDTGTRRVNPEGAWDDQGSKYPPCSCPHCRRQQANQ
ncbi:hypothetical protein ACWDO7_29845 [Streptomyces sp. NPDC003656]